MKKKIITISLIAFFSIGLWVSVALSEIYVTTIQVPINFDDLPQNYSVGYSSINSVYLQVKGKGWEIAKLNLGGEYDFNLPVHRRPGKHVNNLSDFIESNTWLTSSFQVLEISPAQIEYEIEKVGSKRVPLIKNFKLDFKPGYGPASKIKISPETVVIYGPMNLLEKIDSVRTEYREFLNVSDDVKIDLPIAVLDGIAVSGKKCSIEFEVQKIVEKSFKELVVETRNVPKLKSLILYPSKINIVLRGGINKLGRLTNDSIKAYVDYWSALKEDSKTIVPALEIPPFTTVVNTQPKKLEYIIKQY